MNQFKKLVEKYLITETPTWEPHIFKGSGLSVFHPEHGTEYMPDRSSDMFDDMGAYFDDLVDGGYDPESVDGITGWFGRLVIPGPQNTNDPAKIGSIDSTEWVYASTKHDLLDQLIFQAEGDQATTDLLNKIFGDSALLKYYTATRQESVIGQH